MEDVKLGLLWALGMCCTTRNDLHVWFSAMIESGYKEIMNMDVSWVSAVIDQLLRPEKEVSQAIKGT